MAKPSLETLNTAFDMPLSELAGVDLSPGGFPYGLGESGTLDRWFWPGLDAKVALAWITPEFRAAAPGFAKRRMTGEWWMLGGYANLAEARALGLPTIRVVVFKIEGETGELPTTPQSLQPGAYTPGPGPFPTSWPPMGG